MYVFHTCTPLYVHTCVVLCPSTATTVRRVGEGHMAGISAEQFHGLLTEFGISVDPITAQKLFERYDRNRTQVFMSSEYILTASK